MAHIAIIGGGLTGLVCAWHLGRIGVNTCIFERRGRVGGAMRTVRRDGYLVEEGPNTLQLTACAQEDFLAAAGLAGRLVEARPAADRRYLVRDGRPHAVPSSPLGFLTTPLFSAGAKLGLARELFARRAPPDADETLAGFVRRRLGEEFLTYAINPFVGGVYAGDPEQLSVRHGFPKLWRLEQEHRSLILGAMALRRRRRRDGTFHRTRLVSTDGGMQGLAEGIAESCGAEIRTGAQVSGVESAAGRWRVAWSAGTEDVREEEFDGVVLALPAGDLASLKIGGGRPLAALDAIPHPPVASCALGFRRGDVGHPLDGFGVLVPRAEPFQILGALFSSTLFPGRAPEGHVLLTVFAGGTRRPDLALLPENELMKAVMCDLQSLLGVRAEPVFRHVTVWPRSIPQYLVGHGRHVEAMKAVEADNPGLFIGGNARDGISLSYCLGGGARLATEVRAWLGR